MTLRNERIRLLLDGREIAFSENYRAQQSIFTVPTSFSLDIGSSLSAAELAYRFPEWTPFEIFVGDTKVQEGETDGYTLGGGDDNTKLTLNGRGYLARLVDTMIENDRSFSESSFFDLTFKAFEEVGLGDKILLSFNSANSFAITGSQTVISQTSETEEVEQTEISSGPNKRIVHNTITAKVGTTWMQFLLDQYRKAGLFLWQDHEGGYVLSEPNKQTDPVYRIIARGRETNVLGHPKFTRDATKRYSECVVYGRGGGGKQGRNKIVGRFVDDEIAGLLGNRTKKLVIYNPKITDTKEAEYLARRKIAESRRNGWKLVYTVSGHTTERIDGSGRFPWRADSTVEVIDKERGIFGNMYIQNVDFIGEKDRTTTDLEIMRIEDMIFAEKVPSTGQASRANKGLKPAKGVTSTERELSKKGNRFIITTDEERVIGGLTTDTNDLIFIPR